MILWCTMSYYCNRYNANVNLSIEKTKWKETTQHFCCKCTLQLWTKKIWKQILYFKLNAHCYWLCANFEFETHKNDNNIIPSWFIGRPPIGPCAIRSWHFKNFEYTCRKKRKNGWGEKHARHWVPSISRKFGW